ASPAGATPGPVQSSASSFAGSNSRPSSVVILPLQPSYPAPRRGGVGDGGARRSGASTQALYTPTLPSPSRGRGKRRCAAWSCHVLRQVEQGVALGDELRPFGAVPLPFGAAQRPLEPLARFGRDGRQALGNPHHVVHFR